MKSSKIEVILKSLTILELICFGIYNLIIIFLAILLLLLGEYLFAALAFSAVVIIAILFKLEIDNKISSSQWYKVTCILLPLALCLSILLRSVTLFFLALVMYCSQDINRLEQQQESASFIRRIKIDKTIMILSCIVLAVNLVYIRLI